MTLVTGKAGSFVFNYFVSNYEDYYQRLEDAFEAVLYTLLDEPSKANSILEQILKKGSQLGLEEIVIGMAHRGRLNVLNNILK